MTSWNDLVPTVPAWRESAYEAVRGNGSSLGADPWVNARIWRAVECALDDVELSVRRGLVPTPPISTTEEAR